MLNAAQEVEFSVIHEHLGISASVLSKQISHLADAGYVNQHRAAGDSRRVWLKFTPTGQAAYRSHIAALRAIVDET